MPGRLHATDDAAAAVFYAEVLRALNAADIPCLVAGTYALERHAGITRGTKDLDLFIVRDDWARVVATLEGQGLHTKLTFSHWLGKAFRGDHFVDFVFAGGNGLVRVDAGWFTHALPAEVCGEPVLLCAPEEFIWSKAFVMERERFDGADVLHMIRTTGGVLDWNRLLARFGWQWQVLLAHLVLFDFVYPDARRLVPAWVRRALLARAAELPTVGPAVCRGTLLSRSQYLVDVEMWGYEDARLVPHGSMDQEQVTLWTEAARQESGVDQP